MLPKRSLANKRVQSTRTEQLAQRTCAEQLAQSNLHKAPAQSTCEKQLAQLHEQIRTGSLARVNSNENTCERMLAREIQIYFCSAVPVMDAISRTKAKTAFDFKLTPGLLCYAFGSLWINSGGSPFSKDLTFPCPLEALSLPSFPTASFELWEAWFNSLSFQGHSASRNLRTRVQWAKYLQNNYHYQPPPPTSGENRGGD